MSADPELAAMAQISAVLASLDEPTRERILDWARSRYGQSPVSVDRGLVTATASPAFDEFVDLFHAVDPDTDGERALAAAYWLQNLKGQPSFQGREVNDLLKDLGHALSNVTDALGSLQARRPAFVRQVSKSGRSQQARKTYRLTREGSEWVSRRIGTESMDVQRVDRKEDSE
jgi:hypothetical protein